MYYIVENCIIRIMYNERRSYYNSTFKNKEGFFHIAFFFCRVVNIVMCGGTDRYSDKEITF